MEPLEDRRLLSYTITNLGSLGGTVSTPLHVNNQGEVVGFSETTNNAAAHAFLYSHGRMTDLGTLGGKISVATGINDRGAVVGLSNIAPGNTQVDAFIEQGGKLRDLGPVNPGVVEAGVISINASGVVSGLAANDYDALIDRHGTDIDLGSLTGVGSTAKALNDSGEVVGFSETGFVPAANSSSQPTVFYHAFLYNHGKMSDLGTLGGADSSANSINDRGAVVGFSYTANNAAIHAFLDSRGRMTDLGTLGGGKSVASAINDEGEIVGYSYTSASAPHGFIELRSGKVDLNLAIPLDHQSQIAGFIDSRGRMVDLNSLIPAKSGLVVTDADDINDRGQIVAQGYETSSPTTQVAVLLNPTRSAR